jgi:hypothetical protein
VRRQAFGAVGAALFSSRAQIPRRPRFKRRFGGADGDALRARSASKEHPPVLHLRRVLLGDSDDDKGRQWGSSGLVCIARVSFSRNGA